MWKKNIKKETYVHNTHVNRSISFVYDKTFFFLICSRRIYDFIIYGCAHRKCLFCVLFILHPNATITLLFYCSSFFIVAVVDVILFYLFISYYFYFFSIFFALRALKCIASAKVTNAEVFLFLLQLNNLSHLVGRINLKFTTWNESLMMIEEVNRQSNKCTAS